MSRTSTQIAPDPLEGLRR